MLQEEPVKIEELKGVIATLRDMPSGKRVSILVGVLAVQLLVDCKESFDAADFERVFDALAHRVSDLKQDLMRPGGE
ncbi:MAG: hypothetical protein ACYCW6_19420 [Candidatus Xenobia bacterium]